jgi:phage baseplate assembly protein W
MEYDVAAFDITGNPDNQELWDATQGGAVLTGIMLLAQRFLLELFTPQGSMPFRRTTGSPLIDYVRSGQIRTEIDARRYFQQALSIVETNLRLNENTADAADERYQSATLTSVLFAPGYVAYTIELLSQAGTTRALTLPLRTVAGV